MKSKQEINSRIIADLNEINAKNYKKMLNNLLPQIQPDEDSIILSEILLSLKLEGLVGKDLSPEELKLVYLLKDLIKDLPDKKAEALRIAKKISAKKRLKNVK